MFNERWWPIAALQNAVPPQARSCPGDSALVSGRLNHSSLSFPFVAPDTGVRLRADLSAPNALERKS
jgi:hypothetical protein